MRAMNTFNNLTSILVGKRCAFFLPWGSKKTKAKKRILKELEAKYVSWNTVGKTGWEGSIDNRLVCGLGWFFDARI